MKNKTSARYENGSSVNVGETVRKHPVRSPGQGAGKNDQYSVSSFQEQEYQHL